MDGEDGMNGETVMRNLPNGDTIRQVCLAVHDIDRAMAQSTLLGIGPWQVHDFGPPWVRDLTFRGQPLRTPAKLALAGSGELSFEFAPPGDEANIYTEHLNARGEGLHHLGYRARIRRRWRWSICLLRHR